MAKLNDLFPSRFISAADLQGQEVIATIDRVEIEKFDDDAQKPIVYFQGKTKGLVCNKTNAKSIALIAGDDTDNWPGKAIVLFSMMVDFKGQVVEAIRVRRPPDPAVVPALSPPPRPTQGSVSAKATSSTAATAQVDDDLDDEISF